MSKVDNIPITHSWLVMLTSSCIQPACLFTSSIYAPAINLSHCEEWRGMTSNWSVQPHGAHTSCLCSRLLFYSKLAWVSGVSGEKGKNGREKGREVKERNAWHRCFYWSLPPSHSMIQYHPIKITSGHRVVSFTCQKAKINLTLRSGRAPVLVLLRFHFFLKPPMRSFRILVT